MKKRLMLLTGGLLALSANVALGAPAGDLDPSFDGDGKRVLSQPYAADEVLVQPDGKILVVGSGGPADDFALTRLNPDGSTDRTYGVLGTAVANFGAEDEAHAAALQRDGKVVVAGNSFASQGPGSSALAVARFNSDGTLDATFDPGGPDGDGKKLIPANTGSLQDDAVAVLVQRDGSIVLPGQGFADAGYDMAVTGLTPTGALDGTVWDRARFDGPANPSAGALAADGKVVVAGRHYNPVRKRSEIALARFQPSGALDTTFGGDGKVTSGSGGDESVGAALVQPDGKVVVAGATHTSGTGAVVTRFTPNGVLDPSFDGDGRAFADFGGQSVAYAAVLQPDGRILVAGVTAAGYDMAVVRLNPDGSPDPSFGVDGRTTVDFGSIESAGAIALQGDGRAVLSGTSVAGAPAVRLLGDPPPGTPPPGTPPPGTPAPGNPAPGTPAPGNPPPGDPPPTTGGGRAPGFGSRTLVTLRLAAGRIPATGPVRVRISNANGFRVTGRLSGQTTRKLPVSRRLKRRIRLTARPVRVGPHARKTVDLRLPRSLRRLLKRKRRLSLRLTARVEGPAGGIRTVRKTVTPRLKSRRGRTR